MSLYKRTYKSASGDSVQCKNWSVDFRDHADIRRRLPAFTDKAASQEFERNIKRLISVRMVGAMPDAELNRFLESCPPEVIEKLCKWDIVKAERAATSKTILGHIGDWRHELTSRGRTRRHVKTFVAKITAVAKGCHCRGRGVNHPKAGKSLARTGRTWTDFIGLTRTHQRLNLTVEKFHHR